jgi:hypothetical protein
MIDHIHKYKNRHLFLALMAASLTTIAALLLVFLLPEEQKMNLVDFSKVVALLLGVSLLVSLFFTPSLYQLLFSSQYQNRKGNSMRQLRRKVRWFWRYSNAINWSVKYRKAFFVLLLLGFGLPVFMLPAKWEEHEWYNKIVGSDIYQDDIRPKGIARRHCCAAWRIETDGSGKHGKRRPQHQPPCLFPGSGVGAGAYRARGDTDRSLRRGRR